MFQPCAYNYEFEEVADKFDFGLPIQESVFFVETIVESG